MYGAFCIAIIAARCRGVHISIVAISYGGVY
jgi:hypothetical protein